MATMTNDILKVSRNVAIPKEPAKKPYEREPSCKYNDGVCCTEGNDACIKCGWNPSVDKIRKRSLNISVEEIIRDKKELTDIDKDILRLLSRGYHIETISQKYGVIPAYVYHLKKEYLK